MSKQIKKDELINEHIILNRCLLNFGNQLNLGRRTTEDEEKSLGTELQKLHISDSLPVVVDINDTEKQISKHTINRQTQNF